MELATERAVFIVLLPQLRERALLLFQLPTSQFAPL
jgi:hypothetical protein